MVWFRRIFLFILTNILVMLTIGTIVHVFGLDRFLYRAGMDYVSLMIFCLVWGFGGAFVSLLISRWMVKMAMGVRVLDPQNPGGAEERWLVDTVHRLAEKAGLTTMPEVGIYQSPDPNAFATGPDRNHALVAVSTGLFKAMDKPEIEAVLGHETTHIVNGDMVTLTLLQGVINAFVMFLSYVLAFLITRGSDRKEGSYLAQYFIRMVLQMVLSLLGMMVVMWFSRWREYRADAGGAGLASRARMAGALKSLQRYINQPRPAEPASVTAFKISSRDGWFALFASHPPLEKRIARLESGSLAMFKD